MTAAHEGVFVLFAEDDSIQVDLINKACSRIGLPTSAYEIFSDGGKLVNCLEGALARNDQPRATAVITNLNLPFMDGLKVLSWIRMNMVYENLPVYICAVDPPFEVRQKARKLGCTALLPLFSSFSDICNLLKVIIDGSK